MAIDAYHCNKVRVRSAGKKGRGVFARGDLVEGEVIEVAPVLVMKREESAMLLKSTLGSHGFDLGRGRVGIGLGYASLYNHGGKPNAEFESSPDGIRFVALANIKAGAEILIDYRWTKAEFARDGVDPQG